MGHIYVLGSEQFDKDVYKIGYTCNLETCLSAFNTANPGNTKFKFTKQFDKEL